MARIGIDEAGGANVLAALDTIAWSEFTTRVKGADDGYNVIVGGALFHSYADHPRQLVKIAKWGVSSTAAGRYQLLARYYDAYKAQLKLSDFSPVNQDRIALQQTRERRALEDIKAGRIDIALRKCSNIWASLPGAGYGQHENNMTDLLAQYRAAGGKLGVA